MGAEAGAGRVQEGGREGKLEVVPPRAPGGGGARTALYFPALVQFQTRSQSI